MGPANVAPWLEQVGDGLAKKLTIGLDAEISEVAMSSSPSIVSQMQHKASSGPASWSAAADREKLAGLCDGALSAEEVVSERFWLPDRDADWAWICLTELWQRWWPEKACLELMDDKIQPGKRRAARPYTEWR